MRLQMEHDFYNSSYDSVEYGKERTIQQNISISPEVSSQYEDVTSENMEDVYARKRMDELMEKFYLESEYAEKFGNDSTRKLDKKDMFELYYYFKEKFKALDEFNAIQIICTIAEFFDMNYKTLYKDVITLEDKVEILEIFEEQKGIDNELKHLNRLF